MPEQRPQPSILSILLVPQSVAMLDARLPAGDASLPGTHVVREPEVLAQDLTSPAVVIPRDPEHVHSGVAQVGQRDRGADSAPRHHRPPLEPEVEKVAVDDDRSGTAAQRMKERDDAPLEISGASAEMRVGDDVAGSGEHANILLVVPGLSKPGSSTHLRAPHYPEPGAMAQNARGSTPASQVLELRVRYAETDQMGVVYHANYLVWCDMGRTDYLGSRGANYAELERAGTALAVSEASLRYHASARYDDLVRVETTLRDVRSRSVTFDYVITNAQTSTRLATASTSLVSIDRNGRPVRLPDETRALLERDLR